MDTVCHVITKLELGGAQEVAMQVVAGLDRSRFKPILIAGPGGLLTEEACALKGVDVHIVPSLLRDIHPLNDLRALWKLIGLFRHLRPKIVHTHSSKAGILGRLAAWLTGVPYILHTVHGYGITPAQPAWLRRALITFEWLAGRITAHWVTVSQADRRQGMRWGLFSASQVSVVRPGIDPAPFAARIDWAERDRFRASLGIGSKHLLVGTVSCLKSQKCPEDFIRIAASVCQRLPLARCVLVGDGVLRPQIEALLRAEGLEERVTLLGWRRDVAALLKAFDVFVLTSRWEGLPCVLLEARASRIPIVATDVGGAAEAIAGYEQGALYQPGAAKAMADRVCHLLEDEPYRRELWMSSKEVPEEFTIQETIKQYQSLYGLLMHTMRPIRDVMRLQTNRSGG
ncbi:MAG TPA: glycosyltransferase family 4 protein [Nitrospira sp.]|jgi:glycosyltransferase involved in cell wall biosynthesis|nr:glycosyltransferase family 4 protein [Nitrospira sp.]